MKLDDIDWKIIEALQGDARLKNNEIAKRIQVSEVTVGSRIRALEEKGAIRIVLQRNLGEEYLSVLMYINVDSGNLYEIANSLYEIHECLAVVVSIGNPDLIVHIYAKDLSHIQKIVDCEFSKYPSLYIKDMSIGTELLKFDNVHRSERDVL